MKDKITSQYTWVKREREKEGSLMQQDKKALVMVTLSHVGGARGGEMFGGVKTG